MRVYLDPVAGAATVTTMMVYRVGSADEDPNSTGLSHYLEHLMFKGTDKLHPGDIDRITQRNGGHNNAYTTTDFTVFHFDFAADRWETALDIEADRMRNLRIDTAHEFEQEKGNVIQELKMDEDEPWDLENKAILPQLFDAGPYGHPVIGQAEHVQTATAERIKAYYDRWYHPNNAALVIVGGFDPDTALKKVRALFEPIPAVPLPPRPAPVSLQRQGPVHQEIASKFALARMLMGFNTVKMGDPEDPVFDLVSQVLAGGKTGRLYRRLVEELKLANQVTCDNDADRYPGWFSIAVELLPDQDRAKVEQVVVEELQRLGDEPVTSAELNRARRSIIAAQIFGLEDVHELADQIARTVGVVDWTYVRDYFPRLAAVTSQDIQQAVRKYLDARKRVVVWSVPAAAAATGAALSEPGASATGVGAWGLRAGLHPLRPLAARAHRNPALEAKSADTADAQEQLKQTQRIVLPNGLTLLLLERHRLPIVVAAAEVRDIRLQEPPDQAGIAALVGSMLDEGTRAHSGAQIAETIESAGGELDVNADGGSVKVLSDDASLGLSLLLECLTQPAFPGTALERQRERQLSDIDDQFKQPETRAAQVFAGLIYGDHPYGHSRLGERAIVQTLSAADCREFHRRLFVPNNTVLALVGDFSSASIIEQVKYLTARWARAEVAPPRLPPIPAPRSVQRYLTIPDASQLHLYMGHLGIRRDDPHYYELRVMDYIFGMGSGFTDRLSARIRDREGLAYSVYGGVTGSADVEPGMFACYAGMEPKNLEKVVRQIREEIVRIRDTRPTDEELEGAKAYLSGSLPFRLSTDSGMADQLLAIERFHLGTDYLEKMERATQRVTAAEVQAIAREYLHPDELAVVAAGAVDAQGKPLAAPEGHPSGQPARSSQKPPEQAMRGAGPAGWEH
jgi:zinc protease